MPCFRVPSDHYLAASCHSSRSGARSQTIAKRAQLCSIALTHLIARAPFLQGLMCVLVFCGPYVYSCIALSSQNKACEHQHNNDRRFCTNPVLGIVCPDAWSFLTLNRDPQNENHKYTRQPAVRVTAACHLHARGSQAILYSVTSLIDSSWAFASCVRVCVYRFPFHFSYRTVMLESHTRSIGHFWECAAVYSSRQPCP